MQRFVTAAAALMLTLLLAGCGSIDPQVYATEKPALDLRRYFDGELVGHGMFIDRSGTVQRRFVVRIDARWDGATGTLDERFDWSDGEKERRVWTLRADGDGRWRGAAADVIGEAAGTTAGNALHWTYAYRLRTKEGKTYELDFDDWMFLIDERVLLNRAVMRYWGFKVGEVVISFRKL